MPKQAIFTQGAGQRAAVAAFMLLLLAAVTGLAYAVTLRPSVPVSVAGLGLTYPADWRPIDGQDTSPEAVRLVLENERRAALRSAVQYVPVLAQENLVPDNDPADALRVLFPMMAMAPLPEEEQFESTRVGTFNVVWWSGVLRTRIPIFAQTPLSVYALGLVTDEKGNYWSISMRDDNYRHEDPAARVAEHRTLFLELIQKLEPDPATEIRR